MRRLILSLVLFLPACAVAFAQAPGGSTKVVDFQADVMRPVKITGDSSVLNLLGHVVFYHNGAVITCDSAVRYSDKRMECFGNVVVNKDQTYIYGDRADYNGEINEARIYAPLIKMVDGDATLYTYNFKFNTLDNIGEYSGGGTMSQKDNLLESVRGYYYADLREIICVDSVETRNPDYRIKSDSVGYNLDTRIATFFDKSYIWNAKGEILSANRGKYLSDDREYKFSEDAYILTKTREFWADRLDYNDSLQNAEMWGNIQLREEEHKVMAFGDYGRYWGQRQDALLAENPSLVSYDPGQDTLYMCSDSMFLYSIDKNIRFNVDTSAVVQKTDTGEEELIVPGNDSVPGLPLLKEVGEHPDGAALPEEIAKASADTLSMLAEDSPGKLARILGGSERKRELKARKKQEKEAKKRLEREAKLKARGKDKASDREVLPAAQEEVPALPGTVSGQSAPEGSPGGQAADTASVAGILPATGMQGDSLARTTPASPVPVADSLSSAPAGSSDSLQRIVKAYYNVKVYRKDVQAVGDSTVGFSIDSTIHLYIDPVMWNENNQITSDVMDLYTRNQQLYKAVFVGTPMMVSQEDTVHYNQVKGKEMEAYFRNNEIERLDVNGNGQTYYYMRDDKTKEMNGLLVVESADIRFYFHDKQLETISFLWDPESIIYPMDKIPLEQELYLPGFKWEGARRPTLEEVFNRTIRPSRREAYERMPQPRFPLTESIFRDRERMIKDGLWRDRNDTLSPEALDFIHSILNR